VRLWLMVFVWLWMCEEEEEMLLRTIVLDRMLFVGLERRSRYQRSADPSTA
jgi:hypothetical protein